MRQLPLTVLAVTTAILSAHPFPAYADAAAEARAGIQAAYISRDAALSHFDIEGYLSAYNKNYANVTHGAHPEKVNQQRQALISELQHCQTLARHDTVQSVTMYGPDATVIVHSVTIATVNDPKDGHTRQLTAAETCRAFWVHTRAGWRMKQERVLSDS
jgi:hypothetical protein